MTDRLDAAARRESDLGLASAADAGATVRWRTGLGKLALGLRATGAAERLLTGAAQQAPRYKPTAVGLVRHGLVLGNDRLALLAAARFFAAALDPAPLRDVCDRLFRAGARIRDITPILEEIAGEVRITNPMRERVRRAVAPADEAAWNRRANFGALAAQVTFAWVRLRPSARQLAAAFAPVDWSPVQAHIDGGRPVVLAGAHVGPEMMCLRAEMAAGFPLAAVSSIRQLPRMAHVEMVSVGHGRGTGLARMSRMLRRGRVLGCAPDERFGGDLMPAEFFGGPAAIAPGVAHLARLTGAASFVATAHWRPDGTVGVGLEELPEPTHEDDEAWVAAWVAAYIARIEAQVREAPEQVRQFAGIWRRDNWTAEETARYWREVDG